MPDDKLPWFPFYPEAFAGDGKVEAMSTLGVGAYMLLLCKAWRENPVGTIPDDDAVLAKWTRTDSAWATIRNEVLAAFKPCKDGRLYQPRMRREFDELQKKLKNKVIAGKKGAMKKWQNHRSAIGLPLADSISTSPSQVVPSGTTNPVKPRQEPEFPACLNTPAFAAAWKRWEQHRVEIKKKLTPTSVAGQLEELAAMGEKRAIAALNHTISKGWQGIREPDGALFQSDDEYYMSGVNAQVERIKKGAS